jgi:hypothetical protein
MRQLILILTLLLVFAGVLFAQGNVPYALATKNDLFAELMGPGIFYSVNYSRNLKKTVSVRAGFGTIHSDFNLPILISKTILAKGRSWVELGTGPVLNWEKHSSGYRVTYLWWAGALYYCHKLEDINVYYRIGLCPIAGRNVSGDPYHPDFLGWVGVGLGSRF